MIKWSNLGVGVVEGGTGRGGTLGQVKRREVSDHTQFSCVLVSRGEERTGAGGPKGGR